MKVKRIDTVVTVKHKGRTHRRTFSRTGLATSLLWEKGRLLSIGEKFTPVPANEYAALENAYKTAMAEHVNTHTTTQIQQPN